MSAASAKSLDPGALNLRMHVQEPVQADDAMGGGTIVYTVQRSVWAMFEPGAPKQSYASPVRDALARGTIKVRIGLAPPIGWRLAWRAYDSDRVVEVIAVEAGTAASPFDVCTVREVAP